MLTWATALEVRQRNPPTIKKQPNLRDVFILISSPTFSQTILQFARSELAYTAKQATGLAFRSGSQVA
jgi:hypothetical protein